MFIPTPFRLLWEAFSHAAITCRGLFVQIFFVNILRVPIVIVNVRLHTVVIDIIIMIYIVSDKVCNMLYDTANPLHVIYMWFEVSVSSLVPFLVLVFFSVHILRQVTIFRLLQYRILVLLFVVYFIIRHIINKKCSYFRRAMLLVMLRS